MARPASSPACPPRRALTAGLAFQFLWYAPLVRATTEEAWAARADMRFAHSLVPDLPANSYVLTHNPGMFHVWGVNAGQMSLVADRSGVFGPSRRPLRRRRLLCTGTSGATSTIRLQQEFCRNALAMQAGRDVREYRERDQRFALYRLQTAADMPDSVRIGELTGRSH